MHQVNIAIVGLGKIGTFFLNQLIQRSNLGLSILCASEPNDTEGKALAKDNGIVLVDLDTMISFGEDVDFIFNLTGSESVQIELQEKLKLSGNTKTELISERTLQVVWTMLTDEGIPD